MSNFLAHSDSISLPGDVVRVAYRWPLCLDEEICNLREVGMTQPR